MLMKWENGWQSAGAVTCTRGIPQGTENLPPGIITMLSDLYPRRLWGKPEEVLWTLVLLFWVGDSWISHFHPLMMSMCCEMIFEIICVVGCNWRV